ncbi:MAG: AAA family ATPase [Oscillospiraceae bacterium]
MAGNGRNGAQQPLVFPVRHSEAISFDGSRVDTANSAAEPKVVWNLAGGPLRHHRALCEVILKDRRDVLRVFIHAAPEFRAKRAQEEYGIPEREIAQTLRRFDRKRAGYYSFFSTQKWDDRSGYDLMLDSSKLGLESSAKLLAFLARG